MMKLVQPFVAGLIGVVLLMIGRWGRRNAMTLVPLTLSVEAREKKARVMRRGAVSCQILGVLIVAVAVINAVAIMVET